jgi:hypothetical protein
MLDVLHLHGFKCAGTTFAWILEKNYPGRVAYIESDAPDARLPWQIMRRALGTFPWKAATSHLCSVPPTDNPLARLAVAFVRDPRSRLWSGFRFEQRHGTVGANEAFPEFLARRQNSEINNYQTRHLSSQEDGGWLACAGWQARLDLIDPERQDLFIGVVEEFDKSMVLLERRLAAMGITFDASYHTVRNRSGEVDAPTEERERIPHDMVKQDDELYARVSDALARQWASLANADEHLARFRQRCVDAAAIEASVKIKGSKDWIVIDPVTGQTVSKEADDVST